MSIFDNLYEMEVELTTLEEMLGSAPSNPHIHEEFIASNAPDAHSREEEIAAIGVDAAVEKSMTIFSRNRFGQPIMWDYQVRGMFKDACGMLRTWPKSLSSKVRNYKKMIDGQIFVKERQIPIVYSGAMGTCQRPLRADTMQGPRVALASSEAIPAGAKLHFTVRCFSESEVELVKEWLDYGALRGLGQWRNSGKGKFKWELVEVRKPT